MDVRIFVWPTESENEIEWKFVNHQMEVAYIKSLSVNVYPVEFQSDEKPLIHMY